MVIIRTQGKLDFRGINAVCHSRHQPKMTGTNTETQRRRNMQRLSRGLYWYL